jgi:glycerophosphoryl diester phosphodiesterase
MPPPTSWPYPFWIAHRGGGSLAPENTLAAFRVGASHGHRAFECDVKLSADDVLFLLHDDTLQRTTDGKGIAGERPWGQLSQLDAGSWHGAAFAGEPLPTLRALLRAAQANHWALNLEIKPTPGSEHRTGQAVALAVLRDWTGDAPPPLLSSFDVAALRAAHQAAPRLPRALLLDQLWPDWLASAVALDCIAVVTHHRWMDAALVQQLHDAGLRALVYTVNDGELAQRLIGFGVDGIITDAIDRLGP